MKLSWMNKMELRDKGYTKVWVPPRVIPETDEVTWGHWATVIKHKGQLIEVQEHEGTH